MLVFSFFKGFFAKDWTFLANTFDVSTTFFFFGTIFDENISYILSGLFDLRFVSTIPFTMSSESFDISSPILGRRKSIDRENSTAATRDTHDFADQEELVIKELECPDGHACRKFTALPEGSYCDVCYCDVGGSSTFRCDACDFDVCFTCAFAGRDKHHLRAILEAKVQSMDAT